MATSKSAQVRGKGKTTIDHDEIRDWVERNGGKPSVVKRTRKNADPGILRIDFPGYSGEHSLEAIDWDEFFEKFDEAGLAFVYQDETSSGRQSRFNKFVSRESAEIAGVEAPKRRVQPAARETKARAQSSSRARAASARGAASASKKAKRKPARASAKPAAESARRGQPKTRGQLRAERVTKATSRAKRSPQRRQSGRGR